jgi:hypothetical protein
MAAAKIPLDTHMLAARHEAREHAHETEAPDPPPLSAVFPAAPDPARHSSSRLPPGNCERAGATSHPRPRPSQSDINDPGTAKKQDMVGAHKYFAFSLSARPGLLGAPRPMLAVWLGGRVVVLLLCDREMQRDDLGGVWEAWLGRGLGCLENGSYG